MPVDAEGGCDLCACTMPVDEAQTCEWCGGTFCEAHIGDIDHNCEAYEDRD